MSQRQFRRVYALAAVSTPPQATPERESIPSQKRDFEVAAKQHGWHITEILEVPGFGRDYIQFTACRDDMLKQGIDAFYRLEQLWSKKEIDLLIVRDGDRFARSQPVYATVVYELIRTSKACLYYTAKNLLVDEKNYITIVAFGGYQAADEVERLKARYQSGMQGRVFNRKLPALQTPQSHKIVKNGKTETLVLDDSRQRFFADLAELILKGLSYSIIAVELNERGHRTPKGNLIHAMGIYHLLYSPPTWGALGRHYGKYYGGWVYDESVPLPEGAEIIRDAIPAVWTGEVAELIKAELRRREEIDRNGRGKSTSIKRFAGLFLCGNCGWKMSYNIAARAYARYRCQSRYSKFHTHECRARPIYEKPATEEMKKILQGWIDSGDASNLIRSAKTTDNQSKIRQISEEIERTEKHINALIRQRLDVSESVQTQYINQINDAGEQLEALKAEQRRLQMTTEPANVVAHRINAYYELSQITVDELFSRSDTEINQFLHRLGVRFIIQDSEIDHIITAIDGKRLWQQKEDKDMGLV